MHNGIRLNKVIDLLERREVVFGRVAMNGNLDELMYWNESDYDFVIIEMEHEGFNFTNLRQSLSQMLNRRQIVEKGSLQPETVPFAWVAPDARELVMNQWVVQQTLDAGPYGIIVPGLTTVEEAKSVVAAARYPQAPGAKDFEPSGLRGWWRRYAPRYWGLTPQDYFDMADLWPLDPDGELLLMAIIEDAEGVKNIRDILREVKGIGAIWMEHFDHALSLGARMGEPFPPQEEALLKVLEACKEFDVPCGVGANDAAEAELRVEQGFRIIITGMFRPDNSILDTGRKAAGRTPGDRPPLGYT